MTKLSAFEALAMAQARGDIDVEMAYWNDKGEVVVDFTLTGDGMTVRGSRTLYPVTKFSDVKDFIDEMWCSPGLYTV